MHWVLGIIAAIGYLLAAAMTLVALATHGSDIQLILGGVYGTAAVMATVGASILVRMKQ